MKQSTVRTTMLLGAVAAAVAACGGNSSGYSAFADASPSPDGTVVSVGDDANGGSSSGGSSSGSSSGMCTITCQSDNDCQTSCPPLNGGVSCCDIGSGICMMMAQSACPVASDAGAE
jgi:hypothetical protein